MDVQIESKDVILLLLQFCQEEHLTQTLRALQRETNTALNVISNISKFKKDMVKGRWDAVFAQVCYQSPFFSIIMKFSFFESHVCLFVCVL